MWAAYDEKAAWSMRDTLIAALVNNTNALVWAKTKDAKHGRNKPKLVGPFDERPSGKTRKGLAMSIDELNAALAAARGPQDGGATIGQH